MQMDFAGATDHSKRSEHVESSESRPREYANIAERDQAIERWNSLCVNDICFADPYLQHPSCLSELVNLFEHLSDQCYFMKYEPYNFQTFFTGRRKLARLFIGHVPLFANAAIIQWVVYSASGAWVKSIQPIFKPYGSAQRTGAYHVECEIDHADAVLAIDKMIMWDLAGCWNVGNQPAIKSKVAEVRAGLTLLWPKGPMTVELATSTFIERSDERPLDQNGRRANYVDKA